MVAAAAAAVAVATEAAAVVAVATAAAAVVVAVAVATAAAAVVVAAVAAATAAAATAGRRSGSRIGAVGVFPPRRSAFWVRYAATRFGGRWGLGSRAPCGGASDASSSA